MLEEKFVVPESRLHRNMKQEICNLFRENGYYAKKEYPAGYSSSPVYVRYYRVDVFANVDHREYYFFECETGFDLDEYKRKALRLKNYDNFTIVLAIPESIKGDMSWLPELRDLYDKVMLYDQKTGRYTQIIHLKDGTRMHTKSIISERE